MQSAFIPGLARSTSAVTTDGADLAQETLVATEPKTASFDVVYLGDMRTERETAWRIAHEAQITFDAGYSVGLLHIATRGKE